MQLAIVSDLHANRQAWNAVWLDIRAHRADRTLCLGDIVGYGPDPAGVLEEVHQHVDYAILGNHDAAVCGKLDAALFNADAQAAIAWTRGKLNERAAAFLAGLPLTLDAGLFRCAHGDFTAPGAFRYLDTPEQAARSWERVPNQLLLVGHTHQPGLFVIGRSGTPHQLPPQDFELEEGKRYIVNVGSVGQPRDGQALAAYVLFDTATRAVRFRRVPFDIDAYRTALDASGLPKRPSFFLRHDPRASVPPLREMVSFSPPTQESQHTRGAVEIRTVTDLQRRITRWRLLTLALLMLLALAAAGSLLLRHRHARRALRLRDRLWPATLVVPTADDNLVPPFSTAAPPGQTGSGWMITLGHKRRQSLAIVPEPDGVAALELESRGADEPILLDLPPLAVRPGQRIAVDGLFRKSPDFKGTVALRIGLVRYNADGQPQLTDQFMVKEPTTARGDWQQARQTSAPLPAGSEEVRFSLVGRFSGKVRVRDLSLRVRAVEPTERGLLSR